MSGGEVTPFADTSTSGGAYQEMVSTGHAGEATLNVLLEVTAQTIRSRNYPDPTGRGWWTPDEVADLAHDLVAACSQGRSFVDTMLTSCADEASLRVVLSRRVRNAFADRSRRTDSGQLAVRLAKLLASEPGKFTTVGSGMWSLTTAGMEFDDEGDEYDFVDLLRAVHSVPSVRLTRWSAQAERRSPFASKDDLVRLLEAILARAGRALPQTVLVKVLAEYFGLKPTHASLDVPNAALDVKDSSDTAAAAEASVVADLIWVQLGEDERAVLPWLEESLSAACQALGWSKTRTHTIRTSARTVLARALELDETGVSALMTGPDAAHVVQLLVERAVAERKV